MKLTIIARNIIMGHLTFAHYETKRGLGKRDNSLYIRVNDDKLLRKHKQFINIYDLHLTSTPSSG